MGILLSIYSGNSSRMAKAFAIRDGLKLGVALQIVEVHLESDVGGLGAIVKNCINPHDPPSEIEVLI